jgi:hypothetical protein
VPDDKNKKKSKTVLQRLSQAFKEFVDWVGETFGDPEITKLILQDLGTGVKPDATGTPGQLSDADRTEIEKFIAKSAKDVDSAALAATASHIAALVDTGMTFAEAVKADGVDARDVFWLIFKVWVNDYLRVRNPAGHAVVSLATLLIAEDETLGQLDLDPLLDVFRGEADGEEFLDRLSLVLGGAIVVVDAKWELFGEGFEAAYGWDPHPDDDDDSVAAASRALTVGFDLGGASGGVTPLLTLITVPADSATSLGPGIVVSGGGHLDFTHTSGATKYTFGFGANGAFAVYFGAGVADGVELISLPGVTGPGVSPSLSLKAEPTDAAKADKAPAILVGASDGTRLEIGSLSYGVELGSDVAGFRAAVRDGKVVISFGDGDGFLQNLPGGNVEIPFDLGVIVDTVHGLRFEGGTGLKVNLPVVYTFGGVFTIQYIEIELGLAARITLNARGGFSLKLGPFSAAIDQIGAGLDISTLIEGDEITEALSFLPPKGIGLRLDAGVVKGGGYLFIDPDRGEYAGALELTVVEVISIKAIALLTTRRPDGSDGWSLLLMIYGQFSVHIAYGVFLTGVGGLIGLHHRADTPALTAGMKTGALDDIMFPDNPVADAPRIISRYRTLFPIEGNTLILGPMLELSFSQPPIVSARLGLIFELRNALGGNQPVKLTQVILLGQILLQLPQKALGVPAILKLLVDVVGYYNAEDKELMIRARLRDSFVGIEGLFKISLAGELLIAARFGDDPTFVFSAGGFHPAYKDLPPGIPTDLERLSASFGIGPIKLRVEEYFAITSNSLQGGFKVELSAKFGPAGITGSLSLDVLLYLEPHFRFLADLKFSVEAKAFGIRLCSVKVTMSLEGPGEWHAVGSFSFGVLWWDVEVDFNESWGSAPEVDAGTTSAVQALTAELGDPKRVLPGPPVGGAALVTLAQPGTGQVAAAHPLGQLTISQKVLPFEVAIDRLGGKKLTEGKSTFRITGVEVGGDSNAPFTPVTDHFARGQYMELSEADQLAGKSFDRFPNGVTVGSREYRVSGATQVSVEYEEEILQPAPTIARFYWTVAAVAGLLPTQAVAAAHVALGASAQSARATAAGLRAGGPGAAAVSPLPGLALADPQTLQESASLRGAATYSLAIAEQAAAQAGATVVAAYEMAEV